MRAPTFKQAQERLVMVKSGRLFAQPVPPPSQSHLCEQGFAPLCHEPREAKIKQENRKVIAPKSGGRIGECKSAVSWKFLEQGG